MSQPFPSPLPPSGKETQVPKIEHLEALERATNPPNEAIEKTLRRKFDVRILLPTILIWLMAYVDRGNVGNALVLGLADDVGLTENEINVALSAFFCSYIVFEIPSNLVCNKIGPKIWLPALCFGFGVLTMCTAFVTQYESLVAIRVLLGAFEAGIQPGILTAYARFYRRHELVTRQGIKASMAALAGSFGGLLAAGLSHIPPSGPLHSWRWIFLIEGILTLAVAVVAYFALADDPSNAPFLTTEEQDIGSQRIALEILTHKRGRAGADSFKKALLNINTQVIAVCVLCTLVSMTSLSIFMPTLLKSLMNYGRTEAQLMSVPPYAIAATILIAAAITSDKHKRRGIVLASILPTTVVGFSLVIFVQSTAAKYVGIVLACIGAFTGSSILIAWIVDNTAGPTVRAIAVAYVAAVGNIGAIVATWAYLPDDAPTYRTGNCINLGVAALVSVLVPVLSLYLHWENGERAAGKRDYRFQQVENIENLGHANPRYRMTL